MVIPFGAIFWVAANVHGALAASARVGQTKTAAIAMMGIDHPISTRKLLIIIGSPGWTRIST
jgi:hypothetical protein